MVAATSIIHPLGKTQLQQQQQGATEAGGSLDSIQVAKTKAANDGEISDPASLSNEDSGTSLDTLDWDAPDDPGNPQNWSRWKKVFHTAVPGLYGFLATVGTSVYVPAIPLVMAQFEVSREIAVLPLSLYTFGLVVGPVLAGPLSELYGRRVIYWGSLPAMLIFTAIAGVSNNITQLIINRFLAAFFGAGPLAVGAGSVSDLWSPRAKGIASLCFIMASILGPALGPLAGAYIINEYNDNWRWSMWVIMIIAAPVFVLALFTKETSKDRILFLRHKARSEKSPSQIGGKRLILRKIRAAVIKPLHMMFCEPLVAFLSLYTGFAFAMMFSFFGSYSYVFRIIYGFNQKQVGLTFLGLLTGFIFAVSSFALFDATIYKKATHKAGGKPDPEHRLYAAMLGSVMLPIGLFWFAWAPQKHVHWIVPVLAGVPFGWGCLAIFLSVTTYLVDVYQAKNGASAIAANGILRYLFGALFPLFTVQMYEAMGIHWAGSVFAFVGLAMTPVPWIFYWKGKELRKRSLYDTFAK